MNHDLKIWPQYYCRVADGSKTFEVRKNDRGFQTGDEVVLREWSPTKATVVKYVPSGDGGAQVIRVECVEGYTGNKLIFKIGYVLPIDDERVVFSLLPIKD